MDTTSQSTMRKRPAAVKETLSLSKPSVSIAPALEKVDLYPKVSNEFKVTTNTGGTVSLISGFLMFILFISEFTSYMSITRTEHIVVDTTIGLRLRINFNMTFHALTCAGIFIHRAYLAPIIMGDEDIYSRMFVLLPSPPPVSNYQSSSSSYLRILQNRIEPRCDGRLRGTAFRFRAHSSQDSLGWKREANR
jgi:hypothetical protein